MKSNVIPFQKAEPMPCEECPARVMVLVSVDGITMVCTECAKDAIALAEELEKNRFRALAIVEAEKEDPPEDPKMIGMRKALEDQRLKEEAEERRLKEEEERRLEEWREQNKVVSFAEAKARRARKAG